MHICNFTHTLQLFFCRKKKSKGKTAKLKQDLKKMSKIATSLLIDQKAMLMAESDENGYDLNKYRQKIVQGLDDDVRDYDNDN